MLYVSLVMMSDEREMLMWAEDTSVDYFDADRRDVELIEEMWNSDDW